jgi:hypothetical protein
VVVTIVLGLLRILFVLLVVRLLVRFVAAAVRGYLGPPARPRHGAVELVRDRVCNTYVEKDRATTAVVHGKLEHFCSAACRDAWAARAS